MYFISTRVKGEKVTASQGILNGLSNNGGLYVPNELPNLTNNIKNLINLSYKELALFILEQFLTDFNIEDLQIAINNAYDDKFDTESITPTTKVSRDYFLELYHGPTCAFKDIALTLLPHLMTLSMSYNSIDKDIVILAATSGDTGKAALEGFKNVDNTKVIVFFPKDGVSPIQKLQMQSQEGNNTYVVAVEGNFDDCQSGVKQAFNNHNFNEYLNENGYMLSSANSINIGRLLPQIVYYFYSYFDLIKKEEIKLFDKVNFVVPTGNFGDILAGYYAKKMGLPVNKLICASNENNVLYDFFTTGVYDKKRDLKLTSSPSMDILISSNLERLLFEISNRDCDKVNELINHLNIDGEYKINNYMKENLKDFYAEYATEKDVISTISKVFKKHNYLIDTHTAVAYSCYKKYKKATDDSTKTIILSTASPYKFSKDVLKALDVDICGDSFKTINTLSKISNTTVPLPISKLEHASIIHDNYCKKDEVEKEIKNILKV